MILTQIKSKSGYHFLILPVQFPRRKDAYVSIAAPDGKFAYRRGQRKISQAVPATICRAQLFSLHGRTIYAANQFENKIRAYDANTLSEKASGMAVRDPFSIAYSPLPRKLFVLNQLPESKGGLYEENIAAAVSVLNPDTLENIARIDLPNGSINAQEIIVTKKYAYCTHVIARFNVPTTQVERGWINTNAISVIDIEKNKLVATILIDDIELGAANPYGIVASEKFLIIAQAGTHEISVIDRQALEKRIEQAFEKSEDKQKTFSDICNDLSFLSGIRKRVVLDGYGPRHLALSGGNLYAGMYYSDVLNKVDLDTLRVQKISIGGNENLNEIRKGDLYYHDAALCFQKWLSCVTCHTEVRSDTLNWDLLNDGIGNPKQSKSM
ncbi:MAG: YncE family protein, partial [Bacilli bacterium]